MSSNKRPFGELFAEPTRNGLTRPKAVRGAGTKMVNMGELFSFPRLRNAPMDRVPLTDKEAEKSLLRVGDLLFARQSLVLEGAGKCSIFLGDDEPVTFESHVTRVRLAPSVADSQFYFYYFQSPHGRAAIRSIVEQGAGAAGIRGSDLKTLEVEWCDVEEQSRVAEILSILDDKIELNRRMNETLEGIARAIFKSWFVDFDPVRAKASGEAPESICQRLGLTPDLLALFPDLLVDSELGEIPEGWEVKPFSETVQIIGGGTPKTSVAGYWGGNIPWFSVVDAPAESDVFVIDTEKKITQAGLDNSSARILPVGTTIISARGTVGKVALVGVPMAMNQSCYGLRGFDGGAFFTYYATRELVSTLKQHSHGAVFDTITRDTFSGVCVITFQPVAAAFETVVAPLMEKIKANSIQGRTLAELRDALLPKLLSGELRVPVGGAV
jgi:type I restriction enzyme, S subunit